MVSDPVKISVLMVCLGICRSPMAKAVLLDRIKRRDSIQGKYAIEVDSAGTGAYHEGEQADERTIATCSNHGVPVHSIARKLVLGDYARFDYILAMDQSNLQTIKHRAPPPGQAEIALFGSFAPTAKVKTIDDPYYGGTRGFEKAYEQCVVFSDGFLDHIEAKGA